MTFSKLLRGRVFQKGAISLLIALFVLEPVLYAQAQEADTSVLPAPSAEVSTPEPAQTESVQPLQPGASGESAPEIDASVSDPEASLTEPSLEPEADAAKTDPAGIEGGMSALSGGGTNYYPGFKTDTSYKTPFTQPKVDESSGALIYEVPVFVPAGRNGIQPDIRLRYSSNDRSINENILGLGWGLSIPFIERFATSGTQQLYTQYGFRSSISGELVRTATSSYAARTERGDFLNYGFDGTVWTATAKNGWIYTFGSTSTARQFDSASSTRIFKWMLTEIRDLDGNYATYTYDKDEEQVYPDEISYTHATGTSGIYTVVFDRESRPRDGLSYRSGFLVKTRYRISVIRVLVSGNERYRMTLGYGTGDNTTNSLLTTITERGTDVLGSTLTRPPLRFNYNRNVVMQQANPPYPPSGYPGQGFQAGEVNGDGLPDFVKSHKNNSETIFERKVYTNNAGTVIEQNNSWNIPAGFEFTVTESGADLGVRFVDMNGDGLSDFVSRNKGIWYNGLNNGTTTWQNSGIGIPVSFNENAPYGGYEASGAYLADLNRDGLMDILTKDYAYLFNGSNFATTTAWALPMALHSFAKARDLKQTQLTDLNGDGISDLVWISATRAMHDDISATPFTVTTATHRFFMNTGSGWIEDASSSTFQGYAANTQFYKERTTNNFYVRINSSRFTDMNGDGLQDYVMHLDDSTINVTCGRYRTANTSQSRVYLNTGNGFVTSTSISPNLHDFVEESQPAGCTLKYGYYFDRGTHIVDATGDTIPNGINLFGTQYSYNYNNWSTDTLSAITFPEGGNATITYAGSAQQYLGSPTNPTLLNPKLPMIQKVVDSIATNDLNGNVTSTRYIYEGGYLYRDASRPVDTAFAGFARVREISTGKVRVSYFHQGNAVDTSNGENADSYSRIGLPYKTVTTNPAGNVFSVSMTRYDEQDLPESSGEPNRKFVFPAQKTVQTYDGGALHRDTAETFAYDSAGNVIDQIQYGEVTATGTGAFTDITGDERRSQMSFATFASGASSSFPYLITESGFGAVTSVSDILYDGQSTGTVTNGHPTREVRRDVSGSLSVAINNAYNSLGLMTSSTNAIGSTVQMSYDPNNLFVATTTNALGQTVSAVYDYAVGEPTQIRDENGQVKRMEYDAHRRPKAHYGPDTSGSEVQLWGISYVDTAGAVKTTKTTYYGPTNTVDDITYYDGFGRDIQNRRSAHSTYYIVTDKVYDLAGRLFWYSVPLYKAGSAKTSPESNNSYQVRHTYDALDRVTAVIPYVGTTQHAFDRWKETITDPLSQVKTLHYDAYGNVKQVVEKNGSQYATTTYAYDRNGQLTSFTDALGNTRSFTYDALGRRTRAEDLHAPADPSYYSINYTYDANGNVTGEHGSDGSSVTYSRDSLDRILTISHNSSTAHAITYDSCTMGAGRVCQETDATSTRAYAYDPNGNAKSVTFNFGGIDYPETFAHDRQGRVTSSTASDGMSLHYGYEGWRLTSVSSTEAGSSTRAIMTSVVYGPNGVPIQTVYGNGAQTDASYDATRLYRLNNLKTTLPGNVVVQDVLYSYDAKGRVISAVERANNAAKRSVKYSYDNLDRLTFAHSTTTGGATLYKESYDYDWIGNILSTNFTDGTGTSTTSTYSYSSFSNANPHAVTAVTSTTNGLLSGSQAFAYDTRGNMLELKSFNASGTEITALRKENAYNPANEMTSTTIGTVTSTLYDYDRAGMRLTQTDSSSTRVYVSPAFNFALNASGTQMDIQKHVSDGTRSLASVDGSGASARLLFSHPDHLSGANVITNTTPAVEQTLDYYPFGGVRVDSKVGTWSEQRQFTGHENDAGTGYLYMKARYYDPSLKRFLSQDKAFWNPSSEMIADPQTWNSYAYGRNSPTNYTDPDGKFVVALFLLAPAGIAAATALAPMAGYFVQNPVQSAQITSRVAPVSGEFIDATEAFTGRDIYSGESFGPAERIVTAGALALPVVPGRAARETIKEAQRVALKAGDAISGLKVTKHAAERFVERGMNIGQIEKALSEGKKYLDQKTGNMLHVIGERGKGGFSIVTDAAQKTLVTVESFVQKLNPERFKSLDKE